MAGMVGSGRERSGYSREADGDYPDVAQPSARHTDHMLTTEPVPRSGVGTSSGRPQIVIVGGGIAALEAVLALDEIARSQVDVTLLSAEPRFHYMPLAVAEAFNGGRAYRLELEGLLADRDVDVVLGRMKAVDPERGRLITSEGFELEYDALLIAIGAGRRGVVPGAITFAGWKAAPELRQLISRAGAGRLERLVFAVPEGIAWTLPAYELALMAAGRLAEDAVAAEVAVVSPEPRPLEVFGDDPSEAVSEILEYRGVGFHSLTPLRVEADRLIVKEGGEVPADAVVALPRLVPAEISGLPRDEKGFLPVDDRCRIKGIERVYGAGDATSSDLKQGGIAAQQADAAVRTLLSDLGLGPEPPPFRPALRGLMLAGPVPRYRRVEPGLSGHAGDDEEAGVDPIRWPHSKVAGRRLAPFLAKKGIPPGAPPGTIAIDIVASIGTED